MSRLGSLLHQQLEEMEAQTLGLLARRDNGRGGGRIIRTLREDLVNPSCLVQLGLLGLAFCNGQLTRQHFNLVAGGRYASLGLDECLLRHVESTLCVGSCHSQFLEVSGLVVPIRAGLA